MKNVKLVEFVDNMVTPKAKELLEKAYAMKTLGLPCVIVLEQDDGEFDTLDSLRQHAEEMSGHVIRLKTYGVEQLTTNNKGSGKFLVYIP